MSAVGSSARTVAVATAFALMYLPLLVVALWSFNAARRGMVWKGFTTEWYGRLFENPKVFAAAGNSLLLASVSAAIATLLGTLLALGVARSPWGRRARTTLDVLTHLPVVTPDILLAACLVVAFGAAQWLAAALGAPSAWLGPGWIQLIAGHVAFELPFVALVVLARLASIGPEQEEAARDLYADSRVVLRRVILPQLYPAIAAGAILAFTLSLDDFIVAFFARSPDQPLLPLQIYGELRQGITAETNALSTLAFAATVVLVVAFAILTRPRRAAP